MKAHLLSDKSVKQIEIVKVKGNVSFHYTDDVSVEEPLEIRVAYHVADKKETKNISVTMRTPGNDAELAAGFLFTEGIFPAVNRLKTSILHRRNVPETAKMLSLLSLQKASFLNL